MSFVPTELGWISRLTNRPSKQRFSHVHIDIFGPFTQSKDFSYVSMMFDRFPRWPQAVPIEVVTAVHIANFRIWIGLHNSGYPKQAKDLSSSCRKIRTMDWRAMTLITKSREWVNQHLTDGFTWPRTSVKEDIAATTKELIYGMSLQILWYFFRNYLFRNFGKSVRATRHGTTKYKTLSPCSHVFVSVDLDKKLLQYLYEDPYKVLERISNVFNLEIQDNPA